jgi:hypothetical protein
MSDIDNPSDVISNLYHTIVLPAIIDTLTVNASPPKMLNQYGAIYTPGGKMINILPDTMGGQVFVTVHVELPKLGVVHLTIIYNINHEAAAPNQFIRILIDRLTGLSEEKVPSIFTLVVKLANQLDVKLINVENIFTITPHSWNEIDLLMILYTNQSIYSSVGFIQLTYPQMLSDIRLLLYTPISELMMPQLDEMLGHFGITNTDTLNTLFFILYPIYIERRCTTKDLKYVKRLYKFLITTNNTVKLYTQTTMCAPYNYPVPGSIPTVPLDPQYQQPYRQSNLLENLLREVEMDIVKQKVVTDRPLEKRSRLTKKIRPSTDTTTRRL